MIICAYGGGVNSTAMLIEMANRGDTVDLILFADTGGERPSTYAYVDMFSDWLKDHGMPEIIRVSKVDHNGDELSLYDDCINGNRLPSIAYGFKTCSQKFKGQPQDKYCNNNELCRAEWDAGRKITKLIGFDADEAHRIKDFDDKKYIVKYPLVDWEWGRDECIAAIKAAGLPDPGKSSCFFCPSMKAHEIKQLKSQYPDLADRAVAMEKNALDNLTSVKGLGRNWAWADLLATDDMFADDYPCLLDQDCGCYDG